MTCTNIVDTQTAFAFYGLQGTDVSRPLKRQRVECLALRVNIRVQEDKGLNVNRCLLTVILKIAFRERKTLTQFR